MTAHQAPPMDDVRTAEQVERIFFEMRRVIVGQSRLLERMLVALLSLPIVTIGLARIYEGAHWPSDVLGGYLIGGIWLGLTIEIYRWARSRFAGCSWSSKASSAAAFDL